MLNTNKKMLKNLDGILKLSTFVVDEIGNNFYYNYKNKKNKWYYNTTYSNINN